MSILVTRPHPDNEATAESLRARGHTVLLAPALKFEPVAFHDQGESPYGAVLVTSANAIRAVVSWSCRCSRLASIPPLRRVTPALPR